MFLIAATIALSQWLQTCGPTVHPSTTQAIISVESNWNPYAIHDNTANVTYAPGTDIEAQKIAYKLLRAGHSIDMGLMQVNSCHLGDMHIDYRTLFNPCYNVQCGTQILANFYEKYYRPSNPPQTTLLLALSGYNTGTPWKGSEYVYKILRAAGWTYRPAATNQKQGVKRQTNATNRNRQK